MYRILRELVFFLWVRGAIGTTGSNTTTTTTGAVPISSAISSLGSSLGSTGSSLNSGNATCPSRTANYITHTLPRQCLRTDRAPHNATKAHDANATDVSTTITSTTTVIEVIDTTTVAQWTGSVANETSTTQVVTSGADGNSTTSTVSEVATSTITAVREPPPEDESDSPLDNANFLSFEDWKKQNLEKLGQSPDNIGRGQPANVQRPRPGINNALDTLGEEAEIDLDFTGFGGAAQPAVPEDPRGSSSSSAVPTVDVQQSGNTIHRSKDAGKTCKERTNYASFDCSATVLKSNKELKSASSVLVENKDSYALNTCSADNKFFIVELCDDIQVDTIVLANYEFFSSTFRHFRVSVSDRYPVKMEKWKELGTFEARNTREIQAFLVENPLIWAKYLRIEFLSQYGTEHFCPISLLRVHGTTMIEDYRHQEDLARGDDDDEAALEPEVVPIAPIAQEPAASSDSSTVEATSITATATPQASTEEPKKQAESQESAAGGHAEVPSPVIGTTTYMNGTGAMEIGDYQPANANMTCESPTVNSGDEATSKIENTSEVSRTAGPSTEVPPSSPNVTAEATTHSTVRAISNSTTSTSTSASSKTPPVVSNEAQQSSESRIVANSSLPVPTSSELGFVQETVVATNGSTSTLLTDATASSSNSTTTSASSQQATSMNSTRAVASSTFSEKPPQPSSQESFFKSFNKRLNMLEANSTLSLQYIEEQSRILRDAFSKVEKRQVGATTKFLSQLNETVMAELHGFRQAYDQLWQSTVLELEGQRETYQREMLALSSRLTMVADELVWQKRMGIVQSTLLLLCLALVLFGRNGNTLEVPLMQSMMNRSTAALRAGWDSPPNSPSPDSRSPVSLFRRKLWRASTEPTAEPSILTDSDASRPQSRNGPDVHVEPPSPRAPHGDFEGERARGDSSPDVHRPTIQESQPSSPEKKKKKRPKKPPNWPQGPGLGPNGRPKSPLAL